MAHECPDCGQMCYCGSDCDDCCFNFEEDIIHCTHCEGKELENDEWEDKYWMPEEDTK
jgi:hypothetical protein